MGGGKVMGCAYNVNRRTGAYLIQVFIGPCCFIHHQDLECLELVSAGKEGACIVVSAQRLYGGKGLPEFVVELIPTCWELPDIEMGQGKVIEVGTAIINLNCIEFIEPFVSATK